MALRDDTRRDTYTDVSKASAQGIDLSRLLSQHATHSERRTETRPLHFSGEGTGEETKPLPASVPKLPAFLTDTPSTSPGSAYLFCKRFLDVVVTATLLAIFFPALLLVALLIILEDRGPILYYQMRVGKNGKEFRFYKFRSMVRGADALKKKLAKLNEADGPTFKMRNDPRITRIGRFLRRYSIDEVPQLINVLRGEMTLVGPRPHLPCEVEHYSERHRTRLCVQPGLLCLREVLGRSCVPFEQWVEWDLLYITHRSLRTDLWILIRTLPAVLRADGAY